MVGNSEKETFLKIYACNAFNGLMKYSAIAHFIRPFILDIFKIYTDLLKADASIIKNFEDLIDLLEDDIVPFANNLSKLFIDMFFGYVQHSQQNFSINGSDSPDEDEDESEQEEEDTNFERCARACISSIRQILQVSATKIEPEIVSSLFDLIVWVFSDREQSYLQEGFNVLNLLLYKLDNFADDKYFLFFKVIVYAILGLPKQYIDDLRRRGDEFSLKYAEIL